MIAWLLGTLLVLVLVVKVLDYFGPFGALDFLSMPRLIAVLFFGIASLIIWGTRRSFSKPSSRANGQADGYT
jgi:hypothetical protein